jgi:anti-anti-sigma factor
MQLYFKGNDGEILIVSADGGLNRQTTRQLYSDIERLVEAASEKVVVDCSKLSYMSLQGKLGVLRLSRHMRRQGGDVKIANFHGKIPTLARWFGLAERCQLHATVEDACKAFGTEHSTATTGA